MEKEIRNFGTIDSTKESRHIEGYALVFDTESRDLGGFIEKIDKDLPSNHQYKLLHFDYIFYQ